MAGSVLVFRLSSHVFALPLAEVKEIVPLPVLGRPPGMPSAVQGVMNLAGEAVPVIRLDRLLGLAVLEIGLYTPLLVLRGFPHSFAVPVEEVRGILPASDEERLPIRTDHIFSQCVMSEMNWDGEVIHLLSAERILTVEERQRLGEFQEMAQRRLAMLEPGA